MDEESLGIDTEACDGCGLCAPACPQGAIIPHQANLPVLSGSRTSALFACEKAGVNGKDGIIPCLHALGLQELLQLYRSGMRRLCVATGDCASCIRGGVLQLPDLLEQLTGMLESRNLATITLQVADREQWNQQSQNAKQSFSGPAISRRAFFRKAATSSMTVRMDVARAYRRTGVYTTGEIITADKSERRRPVFTAHRFYKMQRLQCLCTALPARCYRTVQQ